MTGTGTLSGAGNFGNIAIGSSGTVTVGSNVSASNLARDAAARSRWEPTRWRRRAPATFSGGTIQGTGELDIEGNVTLSGTVAGVTLPTIRAAGNWISDPSLRASGRSHDVPRWGVADRARSPHRGKHGELHQPGDGQRGHEWSANDLHLPGDEASAVKPGVDLQGGRGERSASDPCFNLNVDGEFSMREGGRTAFEATTNVIVSSTGTLHLARDAGERRR